MPHNPDSITERRQTHNRESILAWLDAAQHHLRQANKGLRRAAELPKGTSNLRREDRAEIVEFVEMLKGLVTNVAEKLEEMFSEEA